MSQYRVSRRAFLSGVGGAFGLQILLRNLEAAAEGATSPPRLLVSYWPSGTEQFRFLPKVLSTASPLAGITDFEMSPILAPFERAGLRSDLIILYGLAHRALQRGSGAQGGVVAACTGADSPGTRQNDDAIAGGPSFDQLFLKHVPGLAPAPGGVSSVSVICDARTQAFETSPRCLSYGYQQQVVQAANPAGTTVSGNIPLFPISRPSQLYAQLFSGFMPGQDMQAQALKALRLRKSVLDSSLRELARLRSIAPSSQLEKIDIHTDAVRSAELAVQAQLAMPPVCSLPPAPDSALNASTGNQYNLGIDGSGRADEADDPRLAELGATFLALIRAAFQCDLTRVATFMWCPPTNQVAFGGMYPSDPQAAYLLHAMTRLHTDPAFYSGAPATGADASAYEYFCNVHTWFNQQSANALLELKNAKDAFGGSLLDYTIVPFITDTANGSDVRTPLPALILGGKKLGMQGGQLMDFRAAPLSHNALWLSLAQALLPNQNVLDVLKDEAFMKSTGTATAAIDGLWLKPA